MEAEVGNELCIWWATDNQVLRQEIVALRALLASVMEERDHYKEKFRQALGAMEDAREMALERAS